MTAIDKIASDLASLKQENQALREKNKEEIPQQSTEI